jgi:hypothetical protein
LIPAQSHSLSVGHISFHEFLAMNNPTFTVLSSLPSAFILVIFQHKPFQALVPIFMLIFYILYSLSCILLPEAARQAAGLLVKKTNKNNLLLLLPRPQLPPSCHCQKISI